MLKSRGKSDDNGNDDLVDITDTKKHAIRAIDSELLIENPKKHSPHVACHGTEDEREIEHEEHELEHAH